MKYPIVEFFGEVFERFQESEDRLDVRFASIYSPFGDDQDPYRPPGSPFIIPPSLEPGFYNMAFGPYILFPLPDYSFYKAFSASPAHGLAYLKQSKKIGATKQKNLDFGSALHWLVLEPDKFEDRIVIDPGINKLKKEYLEWRSRVPNNAIILTEEQIYTAMQMRDRLYRKPSIKRLLEAPGRCEVNGIFQDPELGLFHKIRLDKILTEVPIIVDYKTAASASRFGFEKARINFKYDWQTALYLAGVTAITGYRYEKWIWIIQEKEAPYECRTVVADLSDINEAMDQIFLNIERLSECIREGYWPGFPDINIDYMWAQDLEVDDLPF